MRSALIRLTRLFSFVVFTICTMNGGAAAPPLRDQVSLNGTWERGGAVPVYTGNNLDEQTYERRVAVPAAWSGRCIRVDFTAVNYAADVFVNASKITTHVGPWNPFSVDVTDHVRAGEEFTLKVVVRGMKHAPVVDGQGLARWPLGTSSINGRLAGIVDDVWLRAYGPVCIEDAFIQPSVRNHRLTVDYTVRNCSGAPRRIHVEGESLDPVSGTSAHRFASELLTLADGEVKIVRAISSWPDAKLWRPDAPMLYHLRSRVIAEDAAHATIDEETRRFGFREISIAGNQYQLNGVRINLWGDYAAYGETDYWPAECYTPQGWPGVVADLKKLNLRILRWHERPAPQFTLDLADEQGLLICAETAIEHLNKINRADFLEGCRQWLVPWIRANRNHPAIFLWSADNAMGPAAFKVLTKEDLLSLGRVIHQEDPTRPVTYDGDGDVGDAVVNYHGLGDPQGSIYRWRYEVHPTKPTGLSEVIPVLKYFNRKNPQSLMANKWNQGVWLRGLRYLGFTDVRPSVYTWARTEMDSPRAVTLRNACAPVALFDKAYDELGAAPLRDGHPPEVQAGAWQERTLVLYNDEFANENVRLEVAVKCQGKVLATGQKECLVPLGEHHEIPCRFQVPFAGGELMELVLRAVKNGKIRFEENRPFRIGSGGATGKSNERVELR